MSRRSKAADEQNGGRGLILIGRRKGFSRDEACNAGEYLKEIVRRIRELVPPL